MKTVGILFILVLFKAFILGGIAFLIVQYDWSKWWIILGLAIASSDISIKE